MKIDSVWVDMSFDLFCLSSYNSEIHSINIQVLHQAEATVTKSALLYPEAETVAEGRKVLSLLEAFMRKRSRKDLTKCYLCNRHDSIIGITTGMTSNMWTCSSDHSHSIFHDMLLPLWVTRQRFLWGLGEMFFMVLNLYFTTTQQICLSKFI